MTQQTKAKRRLTNIDFSKEGSHLALVHKDQGGSANGYSTLITNLRINTHQSLFKRCS